MGKNDEVVAEGRWQSREPSALVNGLPIGPNAIKVYVDSVLNTKTWLWRPTADMRTLQESLNCFIAWPANRVVIETTSTESPVLQQYRSKGGSIKSHKEMSPVISKSPNGPISSTNSASPSYQKDKSPETPKAPLKKPLLKTKPSLTGASPRRKSQVHDWLWLFLLYGFNLCWLLISVFIFCWLLLKISLKEASPRRKSQVHALNNLRHK